MSLTKLNDNLNIIQSLPNKPTLEPDELKAEFDKAVNLIKEYLNKVLTPEVEELIQNEIATAKTPIENSLTSTSITKALSALQGNILKMELDAKQKKITYGTTIPTGGSDGDIYIQFFE